MSMARPQPRQAYSAEDLERLPRDARYELIEGELHPMPPPAGEEHGSVTYNLGLEVGVFIRAHNLGRGYTAETGFVIARNPDTVLAPDFAFVSRERLSGPPRQGFSHLVPDLVLETRSPEDRAVEVANKVRRWLEAGVRIVWELNLKAHILTIHQLDTEPQVLGIADTLTGGEVLPGFLLPLQRIFPV